MESEFYTLAGYKIKEKSSMTTAIEDYLEMIYRLYLKKEKITINKLSKLLNVQPPSVSKMMEKLKNYNFIQFEKYGHIELIAEGLKIGEYLLYRHQILEKFLKMLNKQDFKLSQVEKLEHFVDSITIKNIEKFLIEKN